MTKGKVRVKKQPIRPVVRSTISKPSLAPRASKRKPTLRMIIVFVIIITIPIYFILGYINQQQEFGFALSSNKKIVFTPVFDINKETTSTLCGCLNDSMAHEGILLTGDNISIQRRSSTPKTNYLITAPTPGGDNLNIGFTLSASFYCFKDSLGLSNYSALRLMDQKATTYSQKRYFKNLPFLSIISPNPVTAIMLGSNKAISFSPTDKQQCEVEVINNDYKHQINNVLISQKFNNFGWTHREPVPNVELLSDSIAFVWKGKPKILGQFGSWYFTQHFPDSNEYINILVVKSPFATSINALGWDDIIEDHWRYLFRRQFYGTGGAYFMGDLPIATIKDGNLKYLNYDSLKIAGIPNGMKKDSGTYLVQVNKLLTDIEYKRLYEKYIKDEGFFYSFNKGDYAMGDAVNILVPPNIEKAILKLYKKEDAKNISADERLQLSKEIMSYFKFLKNDTIYNQKIELENYEMFFRYPPISPQNGISIFNHMEKLKILSSVGQLTVNNISYPIDQNSTIELSSLENVRYDYPTSILGVGNNGCFRLKGIADVSLNGEKLGNAISESKSIGRIISIVSFLGLLITLSQGAPLIVKVRSIIRSILTYK